MEGVDTTISPDWQEMKGLALPIANETRRSDFFRRITEAADMDSHYVSPLLRKLRPDSSRFLEEHLKRPYSNS